MLMKRAEARRARAGHRMPRSLREIDYLLGVTDEIRHGALRFSRTPNGPFLASQTARERRPWSTSRAFSRRQTA